MKEQVCRGELHSPIIKVFLSQRIGGVFTEGGICRGELHSPIIEVFLSQRIGGVFAEEKEG